MTVDKAWTKKAAEFALKDVEYKPVWSEEACRARLATFAGDGVTMLAFWLRVNEWLTAQIESENNTQIAWACLCWYKLEEVYIKEFEDGIRKG